MRHALGPAKMAARRRPPPRLLQLASLVASTHALCSSAGAGAGGAQTSLYRPFLDSALAIFSEQGVALREYPVDKGLQSQSAETGPAARRERVELNVNAYCTEEIRQARLALIEGGSALQVLNFCIFPHLSYGLPTFAADLVTLPGGHLIALDWAPNGGPADELAYARDGALARCFERHRAELPDGGPLPEAAQRYFSPYFLWSRLPAGSEGDETVASTVRRAFDDYLRTYLQLVADATPLEGDAERADVRAAQVSYTRYRAESDPARPMLTRLYGEEFAERLIHEVLFDLERWMSEGAGESDVTR